jgi:hypothetical protein
MLSCRKPDCACVLIKWHCNQKTFICNAEIPSKQEHAVFFFFSRIKKFDSTPREEKKHELADMEKWRIQKQKSISYFTENEV